MDVAAIGSAIVALSFGGFSALESPQDSGLILLMGMFGGSAVLCLVIAFRMAEPSNLAPFNYFGIPIAFLPGWLFFGDAPLDDLFPGALLIVAGGLMIVYRERQLRALHPAERQGSAANSRHLQGAPSSGPASLTSGHP